MIDTAPVVADVDDHVVPALGSLDADHALCRLTGVPALVGGLDRVIEGVAHQVHERIDELLDNQLVELGVSALERQANVLPVIALKTAHGSGELLEDLAKRDHAHIEHARLQLLELPRG